MSLRFLIGRSGSGKTSFIMNEMIEELEKHPLGDPIFYIVPEQMTFLSEYNLVTKPKLQGMFRLQVYSFTRLAWRILQETGGISRHHLNTTGLNMLLQKIINTHKEDFRIFKRSADQLGFVDHIETLMTEFKRYCISNDELSFLQRELENNRSLQDKLHDLAIIYEAFAKEIRGKYLASEDYLTLLADKISKSETVKKADIYIDGFHSFTPQEYAVIEQLMQTAKRVTVALTLDQPYRKMEPDELHLFRMTGSTFLSLNEIAGVHQVEVEEDIIFNESNRFTNPSLEHLEKYFEQLPAVPFNEDCQLSILEAANQRSEIEGIGRKIISLARDKNYRYRDIAILLRNGQAYHELFETVFADFQIPYHIDQKRSMLNHPVIELIRSTLEIISGHWRYDPVFRAVKTDLLFPLNADIHSMREKMDRLENYCLAYGIQGDKWIKKEKWRYKRYRGLDFDVPQTDEEKRLEEEINENRRLISEPIMKLSRRLKKAKNAKEYCEGLYLYLEELEIPAKLEKLRLEAEEEGNLVLARQHEQVWKAVIELLDQFVEMQGEEEIALKHFAEIIESGMESLRFSIVPPALDQVLIADLEQSRLSDVKIAFIIGLNDGVLPSNFQEEGILSDEDREFLQSAGTVLAPGNRERLFDEEFLAYKAFTVPSDFLFVSYPLADSEGKALLPSPYIKRLKEMFPNLKESFLGTDPNELAVADQLEYLINRDQAISHVTFQLQQIKRNYPVEPIWWDAYNLLLAGDKRKEAIAIFASLFYENKAKNLSAQTVKELYGDTIQGSISRIEQFNSCPFAHFLNYGLKLREREIFRIEAPDIGELFHSALKIIGDRIEKEGLTWGDLSNKEIHALVGEAVDWLAPKLQKEVLFSSNRNRYLIRKLEKIIMRTTRVISEHAKASGFMPIGMEVKFGTGGKLPPVRFPLQNGTMMELAGRIDRIDEAENEKGVFLRVIDYKSSNRDLDLGEVYYGLALQMLTYLDIVLIYSEKLVGKKADPAGVLYFHVQNPTVKSKKPLTPEEIEDEIYKQFKMKGLVLSDPDVVRLMDQTLETGNSKIISAGIKRDGTLNAYSKAASKEDFHTMREYVHHVFDTSGNKIAEGNVDIAPYKLKDRTACQFCPFKSICRFDPALKENEYRQLSPLNQKDALELVKGVVKK